MSERHLLIFGLGFSGQAIVERVTGKFNSITGTSRSEEKCLAFGKSGIQGVQFAGEVTDELKAALSKTTHIVVSISPGENDPVLAALPNLNECAPNLKWIGYLSTVGVYGHHDGAWVDETSELRPVSERSKQRVAAEEAWQELSEKAQIPLAIYRLSGIYGPGRNWFINIEKGRSRRLVKPGQVFNRIHREDIAQAVDLAIEKTAEGIFNITDDNPAPPQDVVTMAHELMGIEPPPEVDFESADISPMARSFYGENKQVSNAKSKSELGMQYLWPNYQTSLQRMWEEGSWKA